MRILHTSDWHLGQSLCDESRAEEQQAFLRWLQELVERERVDALLVSGDIFDSGTPPNQAMTMYYSFLSGVRALEGACRHVVITGGNHDSPTLLNASASYLGLDNIHIIGRAPRDQADEVIIIDDADGTPALAVCAVPYLRAGDIPREGDSDPSRQDTQLSQGVARHFAEARRIALERAAALGRPLPLVAMGHLYARGVDLNAGRAGERSLVVGTLGAVDPTPLAAGFDYTALGHIHSPQSLDAEGRLRYSGAPMTMEFGERSQNRHVLLVDFTDDASAPASRASGWRGRVSVTEVPVPVFRRLLRLSGSKVEDLAGAARRLALEEQAAGAALPSWVAVDYTGATPPVDWREKITAAAQEQGGLVFAAMRDLSPREVGGLKVAGADLSALTPMEVFDRCLDSQKEPWPDEDRAVVRRLFAQLLEEREAGADAAPETAPDAPAAARDDD